MQIIIGQLLILKWLGEYIIASFKFCRFALIPNSQQLKKLFIILFGAKVALTLWAVI